MWIIKGTSSTRWASNCLQAVYYHMLVTSHITSSEVQLTASACCVPSSKSKLHKDILRSELRAENSPCSSNRAMIVREDNGASTYIY